MRDFKFKFLGTGTSSGIPVIGCDCAVCTSADPKDNRLRTSAAVEWIDDSGKPRTILIDTSPDLRQQALRFDIKRLDAILYTHNHVDHTFGLDEVRRYNALQGHAIDVYAEPPTLSFLKRTFGHIFESEKNVNQSFVATLIAWPLEIGKSIELHGVRFTPVAGAITQPRRRRIFRSSPCRKHKPPGVSQWCGASSSRFRPWPARS